MKKILSSAISVFSKSFPLFIVALFFSANINIGFAQEVTNPGALDDTTVVELFVLPSPDDIIDYVTQGKMSFNKNFLVNADNINRFATSKDQYVALGMYLSDFAYTVGFKQYGSSFKIMQQIEEIGKNVNIIPSDMEAIKERFMNNMNEIDTLKQIYFEVYEKIMLNLYETSRFNHYTMICAGIYIESLHISINSANAEILNQEFKHRVWEQKMTFEHLSSMINKYLDNANKTLFTAELSNLKNTFNQYAGSTPPETTKPKQSDRVIIIGYKHPEIDLDRALTDITNQVDAVRVKWMK